MNWCARGLPLPLPKAVAVVGAAANAPARRAVYVFTNTDPIDRRDLTRLSSREYQLWLARTIIAGYSSYFEFQK